MKLVLALALFFAVGSIVASTHFDDGKKSENQDDSITYRSHVELGEVHWLRDFEKAKKASKSTGRPMFVLFQEIPGCQTCQDFGKHPLSHPLIVEAIEELFVPVTIFNNKKGVDEQLLKHFQEPSWNNPVVRFMTAGETDIIGRKDRVWTTQGIASRMIQTLEQAERPIPGYLHQISLPTNRKIETAEFAMHCYWEGEVLLGGINGVYTTLSGWRDNLEVVQLKYSPEVVSYDKLLDQALKLKCASKVFAHTGEQLKIARQKVGNSATAVDGKLRNAKSSDQKYYLGKTPFRHLPLTEIQATKINALAKTGKSPEPLLSPRQWKLFKQVAEFAASKPDGLKDLQFPEDQSELGNYQNRLLQALKRTNP